MGHVPLVVMVTRTGTFVSQLSVAVTVAGDGTSLRH
jgi:hypothetical protein